MKRFPIASKDGVWPCTVHADLGACPRLSPGRRGVEMLLSLLNRVPRPARGRWVMLKCRFPVTPTACVSHSALGEDLYLHWSAPLPACVFEVHKFEDPGETCALRFTLQSMFLNPGHDKFRGGCGKGGVVR